jgi:hypothetical protein
MKPLVFLLPLFLLGACNTPQTLSNSSTSTQEPEILFVFIEMKKEGEQTTLQLKKLVRNDGVLKEDYLDAPIKPGQLLCSFLDESGKVHTQRISDDPLNAVFEYVEETGELKTVTVEKEEDVFHVRVQYDPAIVKLRIEKLLAEDQLVSLAEISLLETN